MTTLVKHDRRGELIPVSVVLRATETYVAHGMPTADAQSKLAQMTTEELRCLVHPDGNYVG